MKPFWQRAASAVVVALPLSMPLLSPSSAIEIMPAGQVDDTYQQRLFESLKNARTEVEGRAIENAIWEMWMAQAPTQDIARSVKDAMDARESYDYDRALALLDAAIAAAPDYAEVWNQRAFIRFLKEDFDGALIDIEKTLTLEPRHFAALSGRALVLMRQGRMELAQQALREAVAIHPWLKERSMIIPEPGEVVPAPGGRDI
ncbi:tetratricopeptide repeat protein [Pseudaminobacter arsenicus]|uniref:Tetratricopeptide repeat protein n=1 Tax=Borborobacter arsenicus TaxID=1851146 RepID=A0A432V1L1_9HYPH|nr:tetratricopeptide repeat protein [Pseudaminobacter arsenicus]RUM96041.1 tetratricopeptide repeat protein [Pseudaminobacter arsenicus]